MHAGASKRRQVREAGALRLGVSVDEFFLFVNVHTVTMETNSDPSRSDDLAERPSANPVVIDKAT